MAERKVLPYLDVPFQHASPDVLRRMKRPAAQEKTLERIARWRQICPDLTIRSTFIGGFRYEPVAGAAANDLAAPVPAAVTDERWHRLMQRQQKISARRLKGKLGSRQQVIIDAVGPTVARGRSKADAPEIDGAVHVASRRPLRVGEIATVKIERTDDYDL